MVTETMSTVRVPNIDLEDKVLFGLTARQAAYAVATVAAAVAAWQGLSAVSATLAGVACGLLALFGAVLVFVRRDGAGVDRLLLAALRMSRRPLVAGAVAAEKAPAWMHAVTEPSVAKAAILKTPARGVHPDGTIDLGPDGVVAVLEATGLVNFTLRSGAEKAVLASGFARALHALTGPIQILITATPADLGEQADTITRAAAAYPDRLADAAIAHAEHLRRLGSGGPAVLQRHVLVAVAAKTTPVLERRVDEAHTALSACGLALHPLGRTDVLDLLAALGDPYQYAPGEAS